MEKEFNLKSFLKKKGIYVIEFKKKKILYPELYCLKG